MAEMENGREEGRRRVDGEGRGVWRKGMKKG